MVTGTTISSTMFNAFTGDVATGLSTCVLKDGTQTITANIPMGGFKFTGLAAGTGAGNSVRYEQVPLLATLTAKGDVYVATGSGVIVRQGVGTDGQFLRSDSGATNGVSYADVVGYKNLVINASSQVQTRNDLAITVVLSTSRQIGNVDRFGAWASGGAVSAGNISSASNIGVAATCLEVAGTTLTGAGVISASYRMRAKDAIKYKNATMSFSVNVSHDVGSNVNYTLVVLKPTVSDNYGSRTTISTSSATAIATGITGGARLTFNGVSVGDVSNGLELEVQAACGAVTTKNFDFSDWQFEVGSYATAFERHRYEDDVQECAVYLPFYKSASTAEEVGPAQANSNNQQTAFVGFTVPPRINPTGVTVSNAAHFQGSDAGNAGKALNSVAFSRASSKGCSLILAATATPWTAGQMGYLQAVSASGYLLFTGAEL